MAANILGGSVMDYVNIKILGVYYSVQKALNNNLATPMARDIKPIIGIVKDDFTLLTTKVLQHIKAQSSEEKLREFFRQLFYKIDSGEVKPEQYLGHEFSAEQTIEQMQVHDSFMALYDAFFDLHSSKEEVSAIKEGTLSEVKKLGLAKNEMWMFREMFAKEEQRSPITLEIDMLRDIVDLMYEASCKFNGPVVTDKLLSEAVSEATIKVPYYRADNFL